MGRVLVPFDGSIRSRRALEFACEKFPADEITALFVVDTTVSHQPESYVGMKIGEIYRRRESEGEEYLEEAEEIAAEAGVSLSTELDHGEPYKVILKYVDEHDVDHVAMGSHSQSALERFFLGSVAERVVDRAPVSTTVIR
jgi:nucleotide-binding universal stress UspA family protein